MCTFGFDFLAFIIRRSSLDRNTNVKENTHRTVFIKKATTRNLVRNKDVFLCLLLFTLVTLLTSLTFVGYILVSELKSNICRCQLGLAEGRVKLCVVVGQLNVQKVLPLWIFRASMHRSHCTSTKTNKYGWMSAWERQRRRGEYYILFYCKYILEW